VFATSEEGWKAERHRGERQGKTRCRATVKWGHRADFMQGAGGKPAGKRLVDGGHAEADKVVLARQDCEIRNGAPQLMQGFRRFADGDHVCSLCSCFVLEFTNAQPMSRWGAGFGNSNYD
jgi:hypothetical protein